MIWSYYSRELFFDLLILSRYSFFLFHTVLFLMRYLLLTLVTSISSLCFASDVRPLDPNEKFVGDLTVYPSKLIARPFSNSIQDDTLTADIVIFYQPSYFAKYGAYEGHRRIMAWVKNTNESYAVHGENVSLSVSDIVAMESVEEEALFRSTVDDEGFLIEPGAFEQFSIATLNNNNPEFDIYQTKWKGDLVMYVREARPTDDILGLAPIGGELSGVLDNDGDPATYTIPAHEIGHNLGMNHENGSAVAGPEYARAWECGGKRSIMYSTVIRNNTLNHYSSPSIQNDGEVCGDEAVANNARVLSENFLPTSQRREGVSSRGQVRFTSSTYEGDEVSGVTISLSRDGDVSESASVKVFAENGTAIWGEDFTDAFVLAEFEAGATTAEVVFPTIADVSSEGTESFGVSLKFPFRLSTSTESSATINVTDGNLQGTTGLFSLTGDAQLTESQNAVLRVSRIGGVGEAVLTVKAVGGTAVSGADYVVLNQQVVFAQGEVEKEVELQIIDDVDAEVAESIRVEIDSPSASAEFGDKVFEVMVLDNDVVATPNSGTFGLSTPSTAVSESVGTIPVTIRRSMGSEGSAIVRLFTREGSAISGTDFEAVDQAVAFADGEIEKTVTLTIIDDNVNGASAVSFDVILESAEFTLSADRLSITVNDNEQSSASNDSGGGAFGFGLLFLALVRLLRINKQK